MKGWEGEGQHVVCEACEGAAVASGMVIISGNVFFRKCYQTPGFEHRVRLMYTGDISLDFSGEGSQAPGTPRRLQLPMFQSLS